MYMLLDVPVVTCTTHKDLGIVLSIDLASDHHYVYAITKVYRMFSLLCQTFSRSLSIPVKKQLYLSLVRSQFTYGSLVWRSCLMLIEQIQHRATKVTLNDYHSNYYYCLIKMEILPIIYIFELYDVIFFV